MSVEMNVGAVEQVCLGIFFLVFGNYMPKCRQNYTVGIKLPWTLEDEENWNHTHRMAGWLRMLCGILVIANVFLDFLGNEYAIIGLILIMAFMPMGYSFLYYIRHKE